MDTDSTQPQENAGEDIYPPDVDDMDEQDTVTDAVPRQRAASIRGRALQAKRPKVKPTKKINPNRILAQEKRRQALELRKGGASYDQIAKAVGYADQSGARKAVLKAFGDVIQEPALEVKTIQIERLNHMLLTLWPKVQQGDESAIRTSLQVMDKLDRLMGTEQAQQVDVNIHQQNAVLVIDGNKDDYIAAMKRMVGVGLDGANIPDTHQITAHAEAGTHPQPVDSRVDSADIIDAVVVEDGTSAGDDPGDAPESIPAKPTKKTFNFGVDPTAKRST